MIADVDYIANDADGFSWRRLAAAVYFAFQDIGIWFERAWANLRLEYYRATVPLLMHRGADVIYARANNLDVTEQVVLFYRHDTIQSPASLQRWLSKLDIHTTEIHILICRDGLVYQSHMDLDNDKELIADQETTDISLTEIPSVQVLPYVTITIDD